MKTVMAKTSIRITTSTLTRGGMFSRIQQRKVKAAVCRAEDRVGVGQRCHANAGFTLTEALATVIIVGLVTMVMAGGIALASKQFTQSIAHSQAQQLYSALAQTIDNDLRYTNTYYGSSDHVTGYVSIAHGMSDANKDIDINERKLYLKTLSSSGEEQEDSVPGELALCNVSTEHSVKNRLVGRGSYNNGLKASVTSFTYDEKKRLFSITLVISRQSGDISTELLNKTFSVKALNDPTLS